MLTRGLESAGIALRVVETIAGPLEQAGDLGLLRFGTAVAVLSQLVSNVPATILFVPTLQSIAPDTARSLWLALAAFSTLAGNFTILGSAANVTVLESAPREGIDIGFFEYAKVGAPVTVVTLAAARLWLR
jgi:Na+/H+ antiporter NhaD/arsenite permease-like protein